MSIHYFLVELGPLHLGEKPSLTTQEFLKKAHNCLSEAVINDLAEIEKITVLDRAIRDWRHTQTYGGEFSWPNIPLFQTLQNYHEQTYFKPLVVDEPQVLRRLLLEMMIRKGGSEFISKFARESLNFYEVLSAVLAKKNHFSRCNYGRELLGHFDSTAQMIDLHFNGKDFHLSGRHNFIEKINQALQSDDPLVLEHCVATHFFSLADVCADLGEFHTDKILAYFIKLTICERFGSFDEENGQIVLQRLVQSVRLGGGYE